MVVCKRYRRKNFEQIITVACLKKQPTEFLREKRVLKNFTGKLESLFNKVSGLRVFSTEICKIFKSTYI